MRVAWLEPPSLTLQGDQFYRTVQPAMGLSELRNTYVVAGNWLQPPMHGALESADLVMLCQAVDGDLLSLVQRRRRLGRTTLFEINDNFLEPTAFGDVGSFYHSPAQSSLILQLAALADGLVVSTPYLAKLFGHLNPHTLVLQNAVQHVSPQALDPRPPHAEATSLRLGWAGSAGHRSDLEALLPIVAEVLRHHSEVTLCIMAPKALHGLFAGIAPHRLELHDATDLQGYLRFVSSLHVGLAPLLDTPFNRGRSDVKFLEYARMGVAVVASSGPAYQTIVHNETGLLASSIDELGHHALCMLKDAKLRQRLRLNAAQYVARERLEPSTRLRLARFVRARMVGRTASRGLADARWFKRIVANREPRPANRFAYLTGDERESALFVGLQAAQRGSQNAPLARALRAMPSFYLPHLYAGAFCKNTVQAIDHLTRAQKLAPASVAVAHSLTQAYLRAHEPAQALAMVQTVAPTPQGLGYGPLWHAISNAHEALHDAQGSTHALLRALDTNNFYTPPAQALVHKHLNLLSAQADGIDDVALQKCMACLEQALAGPAASVADAYALGRLWASQGRWPESQSALSKAVRLTSTQMAHHQQASILEQCLPWLAKAALHCRNMSLAHRAMAQLDRLRLGLPATMTHQAEKTPGRAPLLG